VPNILISVFFWQSTAIQDCLGTAIQILLTDRMTD